MRTWVRAEVATWCGGVAPSGKACPHIIAAGDPMLVMEIKGVPRRKYRCPTCAGEAVPELPPQLERRIEPTRMQPIQSIARMLPLDWKTRQAGDREPGQEG